MENKWFKYSNKFSLELSEKEFLKMAKPKTELRTLYPIIENELYHCWLGIVDGEWGGTANDWKKVFYWNLFNEGHIEQTENSIQEYGKFLK